MRKTCFTEQRNSGHLKKSEQFFSLLRNFVITPLESSWKWNNWSSGVTFTKRRGFKPWMYMLWSKYDWHLVLMRHHAEPLLSHGIPYYQFNPRISLSPTMNWYNAKFEFYLTFTHHINLIQIFWSSTFPVIGVA